MENATVKVCLACFDDKEREDSPEGKAFSSFRWRSTDGMSPQRGVFHWARPTDSATIGNCLNRYGYRAYCGLDFDQVIDSGD